MKPGDEITTERLVLRHWDKNKDGAAFHLLNSDHRIMEFFPDRRTRQESDALMDVIAQMIVKNGYGWTAMALKDTGQIIGMAGIAAIPPDFPNGPGTEIGWRVLPEYWGKGYATEAARAFLDYGFSVLDIKKIQAFAVKGNIRSFAVMNRIGMKLDDSREFDHPRISNKHPNLRRHSVYTITRDMWQEELHRKWEPVSRPEL